MGAGVRAPISWSELLATLSHDDPGLEVYRRARAWNFTEGYVTPVRSGDGSLGLVSVGGERGPLQPQEQLFLQAVSTVALHRAEVIASLTARSLVSGDFGLAERERLTLDETPHAMVVVDAESAILHANRAGEQLLMAGAGLHVRGGRLCALDPDSDRQLAALIADASSGVAQDRRGGTMSCPALDGGQDHQITVEPLRPNPSSTAPNTPLVVVYIAQPSTDIAAYEQQLRAAFSLTDAEWRVTAALYRGERLQELATKLGTSVNTLRVQLRSVFHKTSTHRQSELIATIGAMVAASTPVRRSSGSRPRR